MKNIFYLSVIITLILSCEDDDGNEPFQPPKEDAKARGELIYKNDTLLLQDAIFEPVGGSLLLIDDSIDLDNPPTEEFCIDGIALERDSLMEGSFSMPGFLMVFVTDFCLDDLDSNDVFMSSGNFSILQNEEKYEINGTASDSAGNALTFRYNGRVLIDG